MNMRELRKHVDLISRAYPPLHPFALRKSKSLDEGEGGDINLQTIKGEKRLLIRIADLSAWKREDLEQFAAEMILHHEIAHGLQWRPDHQEERRLSDHDDEYGICAARVWRFFREKGS